MTGLNHFRDDTAWVVQATYTDDLTSLRWRLDANGWLQLEYRYRRLATTTTSVSASTIRRLTSVA